MQYLSTIRSYNQYNFLPMNRGYYFASVSPLITVNALSTSLSSNMNVSSEKPDTISMKLMPCQASAWKKG